MITKRVALMLCWAVAVSVWVLSPVSVEANPVFMTDPAGGGQSHENRQPGLGINYLVALEGVYPSSDSGPFPVGEPFFGEITMFAGNFAPRGWSFADGQTLAISSNTALFSLFGTVYGGNGETTFKLPDLRGRSAMHFGNGAGLSSWQLGSIVGTDKVTLNETQMPAHTHPVDPPIGTTESSGGGQAHTNMAPSLAINYFLPPDTGAVQMAGFGFAPNGAALANGQILPVGGNEDWFSQIGTTFGDAGEGTFALPNLQGRLVMHEGQGPGLSPRNLGDTVGVETVTLETSELATHVHTADVVVGEAGGGQAHENMQPTNTLNYIIARSGLFPSESLAPLDFRESSLDDPLIGEIRLFAGDVPPEGWSFTDGEILPINQNQALFSVLGTTYGGNGETNFALPDLRGRVPVHVGHGGGSLPEWQLGQKHGEEMVALSLDEIPSHSHDYVPEPSTGLLALVGALGVLMRRRRRGSRC